MKILLINTNIRGTVSGEETLWSVLADNLPDCQAIALANFRGDIEQYLKNNPPKILISNSILGNIKAPRGVKKIVLLQDNFVAMKELLPFTFRRLVAKIIKPGNDFYTRMVKKQKRPYSILI